MFRGDVAPEEGPQVIAADARAGLDQKEIEVRPMVAKGQGAKAACQASADNHQGPSPHRLAP
jgi:hypothetical protein